MRLVISTKWDPQRVGPREKPFVLGRPLVQLPFLVLLTWLAASLAAAERDPVERDPVESGKQALSGSGKFPWYDRRQDDVRRLNVLPRASEAERGDKWTDNSTTTATTAAPTQ